MFQEYSTFGHGQDRKWSFPQETVSTMPKKNREKFSLILCSKKDDYVATRKVANVLDK